MKNNWKNILLYSLLGLIVISLLSPLFSTPTKEKMLSFSDFVAALNTGKVSEVSVELNEIKGKLSDGTEFRTLAREYLIASVMPKLQEKNVKVSIAADTDSGWNMAINLFVQLVLPLLFFAGIWYLLIRQAQATNMQALSFGRSRAKPLPEGLKVTFKDVAGVDEAKEELQEIVEFLDHPEKFRKLGAKIPKGVLLMGAPGTGKTLLARAIAGEAGVPFFSLSGSDFVEMFVGVGASRVRDLFSQAKKQTPCIIFMDEIDAVGRHRGAGLGGGHDEREQTLNQLLVNMDGFDPKTNIIVIAATNRPDILDPALLRPGRFDRQIVIDKPDLKGRKEILKIHSRDKVLSDNVDLDVIARRTPGFTGADLENLMNEAAILAARKNKNQVNMEEVEAAIDRIIAGPEKKSRIISDREKDFVAYHEVGHALVAKSLPNADPVHKVSILPRGMALGYTLQLPIEDKYLVTKNEIMDKMTVMLGGRVAEELVFNEMTSGAHNDFEQATNLARRSVCDFGMSALGPRTFGKSHHQIFLGRDINETRDYGETSADLIDKEIKKIIDEAYQNAKNILTQKKDKLISISKVLMEKETIEGEELETLFNGKPKEDDVT
ncbi:MAG: ATP-dependent zinc metalloprotease FtsH [bacterium]